MKKKKLLYFNDKIKTSNQILDENLILVSGASKEYIKASANKNN